MKYNIITILLITLSLNVLSQVSGLKKDYINDIAIKSCECLNEVPDTLEVELAYLELGLCIIDASLPYKKQIKKDHKIDLNKIDSEGEELGQLIGIEMASICPKKLMAIANKNKAENDEITIEGQITNINDQLFVEFIVKNEEGRSNKYYWLTFINSNIELPITYKTLLGKHVQITYTTLELFDARISKYNQFNVIQSIETLNK